MFSYKIGTINTKISIAYRCPIRRGRVILGHRAGVRPPHRLLYVGNRQPGRLQGHALKEIKISVGRHG